MNETDEGTLSGSWIERRLATIDRTPAVRLRDLVIANTWKDIALLCSKSPRMNLLEYHMSCQAGRVGGFHNVYTYPHNPQWFRFHYENEGKAVYSDKEEAVMFVRPQIVGESLVGDIQADNITMLIDTSILLSREQGKKQIWDTAGWFIKRRVNFEEITSEILNCRVSSPLGGFRGYVSLEEQVIPLRYTDITKEELVSLESISESLRCK